MDSVQFFSVLSIVVVCCLIVVRAAASAPATDYPMRGLNGRPSNDQIKNELICAKIEYYRAKTKALQEKE
jgi:hypothetical protein